MSARDDLLRGDEVDAFELGSDEVEVRKSRSAAVNPNRVTSGTSSTPPIAPEAVSEALSTKPATDHPRHVGDFRMIGRAMEERA